MANDQPRGSACPKGRAKKKIADGIDSALEKKRARIAAKYAAANTVQAFAEEWLVKCERDGLPPVTVDKIRWLLAEAYPLLRHNPDRPDHAP